MGCVQHGELWEEVTALLWGCWDGDTSVPFPIQVPAHPEEHGVMAGSWGLSEPLLRLKEQPCPRSRSQSSVWHRDAAAPAITRYREFPVRRDLRPGERCVGGAGFVDFLN